ncbi:hypothetical protein M409DRAFT_55817 [Zasmidium cellare ATCC 36951]|uniref:Uncharacterized protein n=1 Tax=Zasmidium cellare ATCC 36951 TaxID=1080233 RepID=A0A6A6CI95_ZASCE|nr:uncharacterized protein M409DRAFT_55817 [Zasmidium cellare ATCC 36951]KAF2165419.1 hypothetical protein M409DRAFT_55817 [Zasmidium cellare ATCC 36951]
MENVGRKRFADLGLKGHVFVVTGGASGIGLASAEGLVEAGGKESPGAEWGEAEKRIVHEWGSSLHYERVDVTDTGHLNETIEKIAKQEQRLDGLLAAAGIVQVTPAVEYTPEDAMKMMAVNYNGVFMAATAAAREMMRYKCRGSICIIASVSGLIANKKMLSPVYNSSKAALIQLARNLAMEWSAVQPDGTGGIRVNCISPGYIRTPMVEKVIKADPAAKEAWEAENMMHRFAETSEFKTAGLFLLSRASSFMTGNNLVIDGGHTAW